MVAEDTGQAGSLELAHGPFRIRMVALADIDLAERNARFMRNETFQKVVKNVASDGALSSVPLCWKRDGRYIAVSGNHRVQAARSAGLTEIPIIYLAGDFDHDRFTALQLSHNELVGEDDPTILLELWQSIEAIVAKEYAGLDSAKLQELEKLSLAQLSEAKLTVKELTFLFLPEEMAELEDALKRLQELGKDIITVSAREFSDFVEAHAKVRKAYRVLNGAVAVMLLVRLAMRHLEDLRAGWLAEDGSLKHKDYVPLSTILGSEDVPAQVAAQLHAHIERLIGEGKVRKNEKWKALDLLVEKAGLAAS